MSRLGRVGAAVAAMSAALAAPATVLAHELGGRYESPLPLVAYLAGAAMTVALSFAFVLVRDVRPSDPTDGRTVVVPMSVRLALRAVGLLAWAWIIAQALAGGSSAADASTLFLWVYGWVGVALLSAFVGPVWRWLDPFTTLHDLGAAIIRRLGIRGWRTAPYPARLGRWPAVAGFAWIVWVELVTDAGPGVLVPTLLGYTVVTLLFMAQFGRDAWRANGETFGVWFGLLNRLAPFASLAPAAGPEEARLRRRPFGQGLFEGGWTVADLVLVALATGAILYDGLSQSEAWFAVFGLPAAPVETFLLAGFLGVIVLAVGLVARSIGVGPMAAGILPISVGYLIAHYATYLLLDGQRILVALSDPFQQGWDLLGTAFHEPGLDWLPVGLTWTLQLVAVVGGHVVGAWAGHAATERWAPEASSRRDLRLRQVPLAIVMVGLTTLTLWSLGQSIFVEPEAALDLARAGVVPTRV